MNFKIGFGTDIHRLKSGIKLILGGIEIPSSYGPVAHSDGDVLIHALCDALLGAANLGDIGRLFPDNEPENAKQDSSVFLEKIISDIKEKRYGIVNIDSVIYLEEPKISSFIPDMQKNLAQTLGIPPAKVSIKAKSYEGLGDIGKGEAVKAECIILLRDVD